MDPTCKLRLKRPNADESLEKCEATECNNMIHQSWGKKLMAMFGEDEWDVHCFVARAASRITKSLTQVSQVKPKKGSMV